MHKLLSIAGSDSGAGAGLQADLKTAAALGVYCSTAVTAVTAQNSLQVQQVHPMPAAVVGAQIDSIMQDIGAEAWKTGMLGNAEIVELVAERARHYQVGSLIVDPVMRSTTLHDLLEPSAVHTLRNTLLPLADLITPNVQEASLLAENEIHDVPSAKRAATRLRDCTQAAILITGIMQGANRICDLLLVQHDWQEFCGPVVVTPHTHGSGCSLASAIASMMARGYELSAATHYARRYVTNALAGSINLDIVPSNGPLAHFAHWASPLAEPDKLP